MLRAILPRNHKQLTEEIKARLFDWQPNVISTGIGGSFHWFTLTLDGPPILNPPDLAAIGFTDICAFSFTLNVEPFIPQNAQLLDPSERPMIDYVGITYRFFAVGAGENSDEDMYNRVHILSASPPNGARESDIYTYDPAAPKFTPPSFVNEALYKWRISHQYYKTGFHGTKKVSVILKLPPGHNISTSSIIMHGDVVLGNARWGTKWRLPGYKQYLKRIQKPLNLGPPTTRGKFYNQMWVPEIASFFPIEHCDIYTLAKSFGWEGADATQGKESLSPEFAERHQTWIEMYQKEHACKVPYIDGYGDVQEQSRLALEAGYKWLRQRALERSGVKA